MSEIPLDNPYIVITNYTKFTITNIEIKFGLPAIVTIQLIQDEPASLVLYKTIEIPVDVYEGWQYDQTQIINYVKNSLQQ
jgi:hypothetical protein